MNSPDVLELKISPWQKIFSAIAVFLGLLLFLGRFLWMMANSPRGINATTIIVTLIIGGFIALWLYGGARRMWLESGLYLRADQEKLIVQTRVARREMLWGEIYDFTTENRSQNGESGWWLSVRDRDDTILAQWDRNWCRLTGGQVRRGDEIEDFINQKLRAIGRNKEKNPASELWKQVQPFSNAKPLEVRTNYAWIGWVNMVLLLPCALFSWIHPTGGPIVGSIFLFFALMGLYLIVAGAVLRVDDEKIEAISIFGTYRMLWSEVAKLELDEQGSYLTFRGQNADPKAVKSLVFAGPGWWKSAGKIEMMVFLEAQCEKRGIPFDKRAKPSLGISKNVRVRS